MKIGILSAVGLALAASSAMAQLQIVDNLPGKFIDVSKTGTLVDILSGVPRDFTSTIGNSVCPAGAIRVWGDGGMAFQPTFSGTGFNNINRVLPPTGEPHVNFGPQTYLLPYWDDLDFRPPQGQPDPGHRNCYMQEIGDLLILQWNNAGHFIATVDRATFQVQIPRDAPGQTVFAQFIYQDIEGPSFGGGASATIGYVDGESGPNGGMNVQWSFDTPDSVMDGSVLSLIGGAPPCPCDWNDSDTVDSQDFFDFLDDFFANDADYNKSGETNSQDYFDFLGCFFTGC